MAQDDYPFARPGQGELGKALVHWAIQVPAAMALGYNAFACCQRPNWRSAINVAVYGAVVWYEGLQIIHHLRQR